MDKEIPKAVKVEIKADGTVILNEKDQYTPEELWANSKEHIDEL